MELRFSRSQDFAVEVVPVALGSALAVSCTTGIGIGNSWFDEQRIICCCVLAALVATRLANGADITKSPRWEVVLFAVFVLGLAASMSALLPYAALIEWAVLTLMTVLIVSAPRTSITTLGLSAAIGVGIIVTCYLAAVLTGYITSLSLGMRVGPATLLAGFSNPRFPAQLQVLTLPFAPLIVSHCRQRPLRALAVCLGALWWMCLIGSGSRTGWICMTLSAAAVLFASEYGTRWVRSQAELALLGLFSWIVFFFAIPAFLGLSSDMDLDRLANLSSFDARLELWTLSLRSIRAHPLLGIGPMHFAYSYNGIAAHPHNFWIQLAAEWGLPAAIIAGVAAGTLLVRSIRAASAVSSSSEAIFGSCVVAALVSWIVGTQADGFMVIPTSQLASTLVLYVAVSWLRTTSADTNSAMAPFGIHSKWPLRVTAACASGILLLMPLSPFGHPTERERIWRDAHPTDLLLPRFWQQGWIGPDQDRWQHGIKR